MSKKRTERVAKVKEELIEKIRSDSRRPGNHFLSNRELCTRYDISYLTAHRIISELCDENYLHRSPRSGTYIAADSRPPKRIALVFHPRGEVPDTLGDQLHKVFERLCAAQNIDLEVCWSDNFDAYPEDAFPVVWGARYDLRELFTSLHYGILINQEPYSGVNSVFTDCILVNQYQAGQTAGALLKHFPGAGPVLVLAPPEQAVTVQERLRGLRETYADCRVTFLKDWAMDTAREGVAKLDPGAAKAVVCLGDQMAEAFHERFGDALPIIRIGDETLGRARGDTCLAIPWETIVRKCIELFQIRAEGQSRAGQQHVFDFNLVLDEPWSDRVGSDI